MAYLSIAFGLKELRLGDLRQFLAIADRFEVSDDDELIAGYDDPDCPLGTPDRYELYLGKERGDE